MATRKLIDKGKKVPPRNAPRNAPGNAPRKAASKKKKGAKKKRKATRKKLPTKEQAAKVNGVDTGPPPGAGLLPGVRTIRVDQINPAPYNPRVALIPGDADYEKLRRSIEAFGLVGTLVWNERTGNLVGGHQRLAVMLNEFDVSEVMVSVVNLPPKREKALNVALNKVQGRWDNTMLSALLHELDDLGGIDLELTGFDESELEELDEALSTFATPGSGAEDGDPLGTGGGAEDDEAASGGGGDVIHECPECGHRWSGG